MKLSNRKTGGALRITLLVTLVALLAASVPLTLAQDAVPLPQTAASDRQPTISTGGIYTDTWAVQVAGGVDAAALATRAGLEYLYPLGNLPGWHVYRAANISGRDAGLTDRLRGTAGVLQAVQQITVDRTTRQVVPRDPTDDPLYSDQWHLDNTGQFGGTAGNDANVTAAWAAGYTGTGVVVASVDDGVAIAHPDLVSNVRTDLSYDFLNDDNDPTAGSHGTNVAGVMAAADNDLPAEDLHCGVGVAYNADLAGLYMLDTGTNDAIEAAALGYFPDDIDIYNNSWGPFDSGTVLEGPGPLAEAAILNGIANGRNGLGSIYVWAAGNGGTADNINADGYANMIQTIAVGASTNEGERSGYSEPGSAMLVTAPSDGGTAGITTTDLWLGDLGCYSDFGGTSSASPLTAGVIALMLEANPNLTWRDVQHILVATSDVIDAANPDWQTNGAGNQFSHYYGFGRVNAGSVVAAAATWVNVPASITETSSVVAVGTAIPEDAATPVSSVINVTTDIKLEHVEIVFNATHPSRGQVHVNLISPSGTVSQMIFGRPDTGDNYTDWRMMTVANWGERSVGDWTLEVYDRTADANDGTFNSWQLIIHGTDEADVPGTELVENGGFELNDTPARATVLAPWVQKNPTGDKIKCNKEGKTFAHTGNCAYVFKGSTGESSTLQQIPDLTGVTPAAGDTLSFSAWVDAGSAATGKIKVVVKYSDEPVSSKLNLNLAPTTGYTEITGNIPLTSASVSKVKVQIKNTSLSGKVKLDDISLEHKATGATRIGLDTRIPLP